MLSVILTNLPICTGTHTDSDSEKKNRILDKQNAPFEAIKHQRDKQIIFVYRVDFHFFNLFKENQYSSSLKKFIYIDYQYIMQQSMKFAQTNRTA